MLFTLVMKRPSCEHPNCLLRSEELEGRCAAIRLFVGGQVEGVSVLPVTSRSFAKVSLLRKAVPEKKLFFFENKVCAIRLGAYSLDMSRIRGLQLPSYDAAAQLALSCRLKYRQITDDCCDANVSHEEIPRGRPRIRSYCEVCAAPPAQVVSRCGSLVEGAISLKNRDEGVQ